MIEFSSTVQNSYTSIFTAAKNVSVTSSRRPSLCTRGCSRAESNNSSGTRPPAVWAEAEANRLLEDGLICRNLFCFLIWHVLIHFLWLSPQSGAGFKQGLIGDDEAWSPLDVSQAECPSKGNSLLTEDTFRFVHIRLFADRAEANSGDSFSCQRLFSGLEEIITACLTLVLGLW